MSKLIVAQVRYLLNQVMNETISFSRFVEILNETNETKEPIKKNNMIHVYPINDLEQHDLEGTQCKCNPQVITDPNAEIIIVHNSFDGREGVELANEILKN